MKKISAFWILAYFIAFSGCEKKQESATVYLGIHEDGTGFWDWDGSLKYNTSSNGSLEFPTPMSMSATFNSTDLDDALKFELKLNLDEEGNYTVNGLAESKHQGFLVLLGTGTEETEDTKLTLNDGSNVIDFTGQLNSTYAKEE